MQVNNRQIENFIEYLNCYSTATVARLNYFHGVTEQLEMFFSSIPKSFAVLDRQQKMRYLEILKTELEASRPTSTVEIGDINEILKNYKITYEEITDVFGIFNKNELYQILNKTPISVIETHESDLQDKFACFWKDYLIDTAFAKIELLENSMIKNVVKKGTKVQLNGTEKLLLIHILQEADLFPKGDQEATYSSINILIAALTGISDGNQVKKDLREKVNTLFTNDPITTQQLPEKIKKINNIKPIIDKLNMPKISKIFGNLEDKVRSSKK